MNCLDADIIIAFVEARLEPVGIATLESHVRACATCKQRVSLALAAAPLSQRASSEAVGAASAAPTPTECSALPRGTQIGRYTVLALLGRGGMGEVYAAYDAELDRKVAVKLLHGGRSDDRSRSRLLREAKAIARLRHPNVVVVHDAGTAEDRVFVAMEYVEGHTLAAWLAERPRARAEILTTFLAAGRGLAAAHAAGLVHRDFKPQNVMVGVDGDVRVMDFGLARSVDADPESEPGPRPPPPTNGADAPGVPLTRTGELVGTPLYMAPEQFLGHRTDARADQFSFCEALYQALYGAHPFGGASLGELMAAVTDGRVQPPPAKASVPPWLRRVLLRGLSVDPAARWPSMDALTSALARDPARLRRRWLAGAGAALAVAAAGWVIRSPARAETVCRGGPRRLAEVWELDGAPGAAHPRRDAIRAGFLKSGHAGAADMWERAARTLDSYSAGWLKMYGDACEATHVRGEQSAEVLDLRMSCLADRLERVKTLTDAFAEANPTLVDNAVSAAAALPALDRCADVPLLRAVVPPPDNPQARARTEALKRDLARVKALSDSGQCARAAVAARALTSEARKIGHLSLEAEGLVEVAQSGSECMPAEELIALCREAVTSGIASHDTEVAAKAAVILAHTQAERTADVARARDWIDLGTALTRALTGSHPVLEAWRLNALGRVLDREGNVEEGLEALHRAKELSEKTQGPEHPDSARILTAIGVSLEAHGRFPEALAAYRKAEEVAVKTLGPVHTLVGLAVADEAGVLNALHRHEEARVNCERALEIWRGAGSSSFYEGWTLMMLGESLLGLGRPSDAAAPLERAKSLLKDDPSTFPYEVRFALARAAAPAERARAVALAREALTGYRRLDHNAPQVAEIASWLRAHEPEHARHRL